MTRNVWGVYLTPKLMAGDVAFSNLALTIVYWIVFIRVAPWNTCFVYYQVGKAAYALCAAAHRQRYIALAVGIYSQCATTLCYGIGTTARQAEEPCEGGKIISYGSRIQPVYRYAKEWTN